MQEPRWELECPDPAAVERLISALGVPPLVATLLVNRRVDSPEAARDFLSPRLGQLPDPFTMKGMDVAVDRVLGAIEAEESICVWGDYDVDGVTSAAELLWFFRALGVPARSYVPDRFSDGYGLNERGIVALAREGVSLFITVDCGISNHHEVAKARAHGADVIIVDHHQVPPRLPEATAILNPLQAGCSYPDKRLAACGVTWVFLIALRARMRERGWFGPGRPEPDLREWLDLTAIGTVADMVPLVGVNRVITAYGLARVAGSARPGLMALRAVSGLGERPITAGSVGFHLGPRINAAGRMAHARAGLDLMTTEDAAEADTIAAGVDAWNLERRAVQDAIFEEARALVEAAGDPAARRSIVLARAGWHSGVLGIVASKLVERFFRPTVLMTVEDGVAKGSARSIPGFKLVRHLERLGEHLEKYGGHDYAAGLTLPSEGVPAFAAAFEAEAREALTDRALAPRLRLDAELTLGAVTRALIASAARLAPFGQGNPEPVYLVRGAQVREVRLVGKDQRHVKLAVEGDGGVFDAIAFGQAEHAPALGDLIDLACVPEVNAFRGRERLQLRIKAMRPAGGAVHPRPQS